MPLSGVALMRMKKELEMVYQDPSPGVSAWMQEDDASELDATIEGPEGTPYARGLFKLRLSIPPRYPFEPPKISFMTPIYHPNIDSAGRICLDILNLPPKGAWTPSLNISTLLTSIRLLMSEPNAEDGLMADITHEYVHDPAAFESKAREHTQRHAAPSKSTGEPSCDSNVSRSSPLRDSLITTTSKVSELSSLDGRSPKDDGKRQCVR
ncbi:hypothetical protein AB1Y20_005988 [Prymnesium parvum]|uniref:E2 ubiquitin-conjugating enzyme n=1 Tax=Prymnesium parvum TaxID=97485 RepID=A0AB34J175_PRYPA